VSQKKAQPTITRAAVVRSILGPDYCTIFFDLPGPLKPVGACLLASFWATEGTGAAYLAQHFPGIETEVIDTRMGGQGND
jgi:hypothetical protein